MIRVQIKKLSDKATMPTMATHGSGGYDLYSPVDTEVLAKGRKLISTDVAIEIPYGYTGLICPRSGMAAKKGITVLNGPAVIDSDYRGNLGVILYNSTDENYTVNEKDKIAQILFIKSELVELVSADELSDTTRNEGGFGSTGA